MLINILCVLIFMLIVFIENSRVLINKYDFVQVDELIFNESPMFILQYFMVP